MKNAALYIRVSTDFQKEEGYSIEFQEEKLRAYCKATDFNVGDVFIDPAYSGSNTDRPALQSLIERINDFDAVIVYKLDRLSRSQKDTLYLIEDVFIPNNVAFISISESFDTSTPFGRAMIGILSVFAQLERENIKERMLSGRIQRAKEGLHNGQANTPIGYRYVDGKLIVDEYERQQILDVCDLYLKGLGAAAIIEEMKKRGYRTNYGLWKNRATVNTVLFNPVYRGFCCNFVPIASAAHPDVDAFLLLPTLLSDLKSLPGLELFFCSLLALASARTYPRGSICRGNPYLLS